MQPIIKDIILSISDDVVSNLTQSFEKTYYGKMNYSSKNTILDSDNKLLKETIGFEIAFIHVITYFLAYSMSCSHEYMHILNILDTDKLFSWFKIKDNSMFLQLNDCNIPTEKEIYELINEHDKFIDKNVKKKLGQFYTPTGIAKKMVFEVRNELKDLSERDLVVDPACGTGVFVVETVEQMSAFLSFDELIKFVENNMFAYDVNPFSVIATKISVLNTLLEIAPDSVHKNNLLLGIPALNNIKWKNTIVDKEEKEFSIILGNPPYFKLDSKALKDIDGYDAIIYGQPNIYSLFMHWGISHLRTNDSTIYAVLLTNYELDDFADQFGDYDYELQKSEITSRYKDVAEKIKRACGLRKENLMYRAVEINQQQDTETIRLLQEISSKLDEKK